MQITELRSKLKDRLALGLNYGIQSLEEALADSSMLRNDLVTFRSQYNDLNRIASQGILGYEQVEIGYNKLRKGLLEVIDRLESTDLADQENLPKVQSNDLQHRKENFFELLKIHLRNLEAVTVKMESSYDGQYRVDVRTGRDAIAMIYGEIFRHQFKFQRGEKLDISAFSKVFFEKNYPSLQVYLKTLGFILQYILDEELEQPFYQGVVRSMLSNDEIATMIYFAISGMEPGYGKLLVESEIVGEEHRRLLIEEGHFDLILPS